MSAFWITFHFNTDKVNQIEPSLQFGFYFTHHMTYACTVFTNYAAHNDEKKKNNCQFINIDVLRI